MMKPLRAARNHVLCAVTKESFRGEHWKQWPYRHGFFDDE
jgi:hypothetical protein